MEDHVANPAPSATTRLLIVDDHCLHCAGVMMLFHSVWFVNDVAMAYEPCQAVEVARQFRPHVTLMDVTLPLPGPFESAKEIISQRRDSRVIFLDDSFRRIHLRGALEIGASGYLTKHATFEETREAVRRAAAGQTTFLPMAHSHAGEPHSGPRSSESASESPIDRLTPRELEVIQYLGEGLTVKECAEQMGLSYSTIDNYKTRMMKKLGVRNVVQLTLLASREGLLYR